MTSVKERQTVRSTVNYATPIPGELLYTYRMVEPPEGMPASNETPDPRQVDIVSVRDGAPTSIDVQGFELVSFAPVVDDIYDPVDLERDYFPQVAELVKRHTGASEVRVFVPFLRGPEAQRRMPGAITYPAGTVHVDYTENSGPTYFEKYLSAEERERFRGRRFALINVWRPITGPMRDHPLALCDARTATADDLQLTRNISRSGKGGLRTPDGEISEGQTYTVSHSPDHRWYYVPDMMPDEALLLKNYDSRRDVARFSPHCAFDDPTTPPDALPRASIEVRTLAIW